MFSARIAGLTILAVGGLIMTGGNLFGLFQMYVLAHTFGLEHFDNLDVATAFEVAAELCFSVTAAAFGMGGLWRTVTQWRDDRKV
jgi:hypothetical protein